uniref:Uncharacterized protein MANES_03G104200 n=1 Tax=Rhizophora mucronata TaxID=61149 RepID=A0A2P2IYW1_RHIMU
MVMTSTRPRLATRTKFRQHRLPVKERSYAFIKGEHAAAGILPFKNQPPSAQTTICMSLLINQLSCVVGKELFLPLIVKA